jgi:hypothetical protein
MPTLPARDALHLIWPLVYATKRRHLTENERNELRHLCGVLGSVPLPIAGFADSVEVICMAVQSSGVLDDGIMRNPDDILDYLDDLNSLINVL